MCFICTTGLTVVSVYMYFQLGIAVKLENNFDLAGLCKSWRFGRIGEGPEGARSPKLGCLKGKNFGPSRVTLVVVLFCVWWYGKSWQIRTRFVSVVVVFCLCKTLSVDSINNVTILEDVLLWFRFLFRHVDINLLFFWWCWPFPSSTVQLLSIMFRHFTLWKL